MTKPQLLFPAEQDYYQQLTDRLGARLLGNTNENVQLAQRARHSELLSELLIQGYRLGSLYSDPHELRCAVLRLLMQQTQSDSAVLLQMPHDGLSLETVAAVGISANSVPTGRYVPPLADTALFAPEDPHEAGADWLRQHAGYPGVAWHRQAVTGRCLLLGQHEARAARAAYNELTLKLLACASDLLGELELRLDYEQQLQFHATRDPLTGLPNRVLAMDRLEQSILHGLQRGFHLLRLDIDNFRRLNELTGHENGDLLLSLVVKRLEPLLPPSSTLARLGADEFLILLDEPDSQVTDLLCRDLLRHLGGTYQLKGHQGHVTVSIGVAGFPQDGEDSSALLKYSDIALEQAKRGGRNQYRFYSPDMNERLVKQWQLRTALKQAVSESQLQLHYQPIFAATTGQLVQFEALLRWTHPQYGPVSPGEFIPLAETDGTIIELGDWVIAEACRQLTRWREQGLALVPVAVNISARQLQQAGFVEGLLHQIEQHDLTPTLLELELTERLLLQQESVGDQLFQQLTELGFSLELDDFGTGYSALSYLNRHPFSTLKIDRSFVDQLEQNARQRTLLSGINALAHELGIKTIAEGVETAGQLDLLRQIGCDYAQGYYLGKPAPAAEVTALLTATPF